MGAAGAVITRLHPEQQRVARALFARPKKKALGDCYEAAVHYLLDHALGMGVKEPNSNLRIVHGQVAGQGPLEGKTFGHAWIEDGDDVIDVSNGRNIRMPKAMYYHIGKINQINNLHSYTPEEARSRMIDTGIYGPWDLQVEDGSDLVLPEPEAATLPGVKLKPGKSGPAFEPPPVRTAPGMPNVMLD